MFLFSARVPAGLAVALKNLTSILGGESFADWVKDSFLDVRVTGKARKRAD